MIVEHRTYTFHPGKLEEYLALYAAEGMPIQLRYLPHCLGYFVTEFGVLNQVIHLWAYESHAERDRCRAALRADPGWAPYLARIRPLMQTQESQLLVPASFFDLRARLGLTTQT